MRVCVCLCVYIYIYIYAALSLSLSLSCPLSPAAPVSVSRRPQHGRIANDKQLRVRHDEDRNAISEKEISRRDSHREWRLKGRRIARIARQFRFVYGESLGSEIARFFGRYNLARKHPAGAVRWRDVRTRFTMGTSRPQLPPSGRRGGEEGKTVHRPNGGEGNKGSGKAATRVLENRERRDNKTRDWMNANRRIACRWDFRMGKGRKGTEETEGAR